MRHRTAWLAWTRALLDAVSVVLALLLAYQYRYHVDRIPIPGIEPPAFSRYVQAIPALVLIYLATFALTRVYRFRRARSYIDEMFAITGSSVLATLVTLAAMSLYRDFSYSRLVTVYVFVIGLVLFALNRLLLRWVVLRMQRRGRLTERVLVVGRGGGSELIIQRMTMFPRYGYQVCGVVTDPQSEKSPVAATVAGAPVLGAVDDLPQLVKAHRVDHVFVALPGASRERILGLVKLCDDLQVDIKMLPDLLEIISTRVSAVVVDGIPLVGVRHSPLEGAGLYLKQVIDMLVAGILLVILSPVMAALAVAIRLDSPGPILYRQRRVGLEGKPFLLLKFRSMVHGAEDETGPVFASHDDQRKTRVGRFMRRFSLDELPQLFNVLGGEMSLVGPRPERPVFVEQFGAEIPRYLERHQVRPGITGWAQLNDLRGHTSVANRTVYDIYYIENWSLSFDLKILLLTVGRLFFHRHAY